MNLSITRLIRWLFSKQLFVLISICCTYFPALANDSRQFYFDGINVLIYDEKAPGLKRTITSQERSRVVDAIITFNGAVKVVFSQMMAEIQRSGQRTHVDYSRVSPEHYIFRQWNPDISIHQMTPDALARNSINVTRMAGIYPGQSWLAFYIVDSGVPSTAPVLSEENFRPRYYIGIAKFTPPQGTPTLNPVRHRSSAPSRLFRDVGESSQLMLFEQIQDSNKKIAEGNWQGDPWNAYDWRIINDEIIFGDNPSQDPSPRCSMFPPNSKQ